MYADDQPTFTAYEKAMQAHFHGHPLGQSILGTTESITALTAEQMRAYHRTRYSLAGNIVLAVAGNYDWPSIHKLSQSLCGAWPVGTPGRSVVEARPKGGVQIITKDSSVQAAHDAPRPEPPLRQHPMRYAADLALLQ